LARVEALGLTKEALRSGKGLRRPSQHLLEHVAIDSLTSLQGAHGLLLALLLQTGRHKLRAQSLLELRIGAASHAPSSQSGTGLLLGHTLLLRSQTATSQQARSGVSSENVSDLRLLWRSTTNGLTGLRSKTGNVSNIASTGTGAGSRLDLAHCGRNLLLVELQQLRGSLSQQVDLQRLVLRRELSLRSVLLRCQLKLGAKRVRGLLSVVACWRSFDCHRCLDATLKIGIEPFL
jgi:hypothetical protein